MDVEVSGNWTFACADEVGFVCLEAVDAKAVLSGIDGDGAATEFCGAPENSYRNFATIGHQDSFHGGWL